MAAAGYKVVCTARRKEVCQQSRTSLCPLPTPFLSRTHLVTEANSWHILGKSLKRQKLDGVVAEIESFGGTASAFRLDVTNEDDFDAAFSSCFYDHMFLFR